MHFACLGMRGCKRLELLARPVTFVKNMKSTTALALLLIGLSPSLVKADGDFIKVSATVVIAGKGSTTPSGTTRSGQTVTIAYPAEGSEIIVTATPTIKDGLLMYSLNLKMPMGDSKSFTELTSSGITDKGEPILYNFTFNGKPYSMQVLLTPARSDGTPL